MQFTKISTCAIALGAALLLGCQGNGGKGGTQNDEMAAAGPTVSETAGNIAIQAGATQAMKSGGVGGSIGYGLQSQGSNLSKALFGKKKAAPKQPAVPSAYAQ